MTSSGNTLVLEVVANYKVFDVFVVNEAFHIPVKLDRVRFKVSFLPDEPLPIHPQIVHRRAAGNDGFHESCAIR